MEHSSGGRLTGKQERQIQQIGETMMAHRTGNGEKPFTGGVVVNDEATANKFEARLKELYPEVRIISKSALGIAGTWLLKVGAPAG